LSVVKAGTLAETGPLDAVHLYPKAIAAIGVFTPISVCHVRISLLQALARSVYLGRFDRLVLSLPKGPA
jgi:hypothetical protein